MCYFLYNFFVSYQLAHPLDTREDGRLIQAQNPIKNADRLT